MGTVSSVLLKKSQCKTCDSMKDVFDHKEMSNLIADVPILRIYFVKYIKLGTWMERFLNSSPEADIIQALLKESATVIQFRKSLVSITKRVASTTLPECVSPGCENSCHSRCSISIKTTTTATAKLSKRDSFVRRERPSIAVQAIGIETSGFTDFGGVESSFTLQEMAAIFFVCIFPYFRDSSMFKTFQRRRFSLCESNKRIESVEFITQEDDLLLFHKEGEVQSGPSGGYNHAQKLVYNAAALIDDDQLITMLSSTAWYNTHIPSIIDNSSMSIAISRCVDCCPGLSTTGTNAGVCGERYPLVYVNKAFETLTGYSKQEVLNKTCRFLQGPGTSVEAVERIRQALKHRKAVKEVLLNYKKNGKEYRVLLVLSPVFDRMGLCSHILAVQLECRCIQRQIWLLS